MPNELGRGSKALAAWKERHAPDGAAVRSGGGIHVVDVPGGRRAGTLLVHFAALDRAEAEKDLPGDPAAVAARAGWTGLHVLSEGRSWFREPFVTGLFDGRNEGEWFDGFEQIVFHGTGPAGYAAAAYSLAAPGARVVAIAPVATLDPRVAPWDRRTPEGRRLDWWGPYAYAPDMARGAGAAFVLFDPQVDEDAMHAALFLGAGATALRMRGAGPAPEVVLRQGGGMGRLLGSAALGDLDPESFAEIWRDARRSSPLYLMRLADRLHAARRPALLSAVLRHGAGAVPYRRFARLARLAGVTKG
ncbi:hypothetical protein BCF33_0928 [Hasllibacter halocynthiae]|uniref:Phosphoadenosine phosphosulfate reductase n=1 Tax=Hasllibacter halocynthiae TaxID=595589 RepID=A0A2T0X8N5_9RHOB|nr:phosphoadenosine phosphosulfate reductase [Hasllibacter halocynthiae]PRY95310.1 hypothetical protein BCF33_0928 [Hasllibacter halocynthiae]